MVPDDATRLRQAHFNGLGVLPYEGVYIGFVTKFDCYARHRVQGGDIGPFQVELAFSRDLRHWKREDRTLVIPNGPPGSFDAGSISTASQPVIVGDEVWLYYGGRPFHTGYPIQQMLARISAYREGKAGPSSGIGLAKWRLDGFVCLQAGNGGGSLLSRPLVFSGRRLEINADAGGGSMAVEIVGSDGQPLPGFTSSDCDAIRTDSVCHVATWRGRSDLTFVAGYEVRLRLQMQNAKLYALKFAGEGPPKPAES
jgi:hypothetical protein